MRLLSYHGKEVKASCVADLIKREGYDRHYFTPDYTVYHILNTGEVTLLTESPSNGTPGTILQQRLKRLSRKQS